MKILIDIGHPAHVHYFRNMAKIFQAKGLRVLFTTRDKEVAIQLLKYYGFEYINFGKPFKSKIGKVFGLFWFSLRLFLVAIKFKPDIYLNATMYSAIVAWLLRKPHIALEDTFNMEQVRLYLPFTTAILTGDYSHPSLGRKEVKFSGYQELAYLHPRYFIPDTKIKELLGITGGERYVIMRFVDWGASHDYGHKGISNSNKMKAVEEISKFAKVFISSESVLPTELEAYRIDIPPERMHDAIAFSTILFSESATMASEAAVLGVPVIYLDNTGRYYTTDEEKYYGLVFNYSESFTDQMKAIKKCCELLNLSLSSTYWQNKKQKMLAEKIDVTAFLVWFVENFKDSLKIMKENPDFQKKFK